MNTFIYPEMLVHIPLCTHKNPKEVLVMSANSEQLESEFSRYKGIATKTIAATLDAVRDAEDASVDVVLLEGSLDAALLSHVSRVLKEDGLIAMQHPSLDDVEANKQVMQVLGNYFKIIMPYNVGNGETLLLASKEYHPTADIILQRTDMLDGQNHYNCDIHPAAFAMGNSVRKSYLGVIRN